MRGAGFERHPREALDLAVRAVALRRAGAARPALLAVIDQAETSLRHEPDRHARRSLFWVCRAVLERDVERTEDTLVVDAAIRVAATALAAADGSG